MFLFTLQMQLHTLVDCIGESLVNMHYGFQFFYNEICYFEH